MAPKKKTASSPSPTKTVSGSKKKKDQVAENAASAAIAQNSTPAQDEDDFYREPIKRIVRPDNQLNLTEEQLEEEFTRVLTANDNNVPNNITKYNYKEKAYKQDPEGPMDHLAFHLQMNGCALHKDSEDAIQQQQHEDTKKMEMDRIKKEAIQEALEAGEDDVEAEVPKTGKNQFNFSERAAQTFNNILRSRGVATQPPPVVQFVATVTQWDIYDSYMQDIKAQQQEEENSKNAEKRKAAAGQGAGSGSGEDPSAQKKGKDDDMVHSTKMSNALKILERMVNQNAEDEIFQDFKYWEDASDSYRNGEGSLLPLWRFSTERTKRKQVTTLCWNPSYPDLFAVAYGSYDFMRQGSGIVCCFSLKVDIIVTAIVTMIIITPLCAITEHFAPGIHVLHGVRGDVFRLSPALPLPACGWLLRRHRDGLRRAQQDQPPDLLFVHPHRQTHRPGLASPLAGEETYFVIHCKLHKSFTSLSFKKIISTTQEEDLAKELNFFSISSDGQVASWIMSKNELKMEPVMQLKLVSNARDDPEEVNLSGLAGGCCFNFNKHNEHLFIVGTEEGKIHKCSKAYSGQYLETYLGHHMAVYALKWNPFHPRVFISCSADWTVKIW